MFNDFYAWENNFIRKNKTKQNKKAKWQVTETALGTRDLSAKMGRREGDAARESGSVKLPSRDVYQGFLDHEAEGL